MTISDRPVRSDFSRVFIIENQAGPANVPDYQGVVRITDAEQDFGEPERIEVPSPARYGSFIEVAEVPSEIGRPSATLEGRYPMSLSDMLRMAREGCPFDAQIHIGDCKDPRDFDRGWEKILVFERALYSSWSASNLGALSSGDREAVNEEGELTSSDMFEVVQIALAERAGTLVNTEIVSVVVCDQASCGDCDDPSDGCQKVFAISIPVAGSPGINPEVIYTADGGVTFGDTDIDTMAAADIPSGAACVGENLVIVSNGTDSLHYADRDDIVAGTEVWTEVTNGFVAAGSPNAISVASPRDTWIVGDGGYIYVATDPTSEVVVQDAGVATAQNLNDVHAFNSQIVVAVGAANAVVYTTNGGAVWQAVVGPAVAVALNAIFVLSENTWWVGAANGSLYYTTDQGQNWTEKGFPGSGAGEVRDIIFVNSTVGFISHDTATPAGRILRTVSGGNTWYVLPESIGAIPANDQINSLAVCEDDSNTIWGGGLADDGTDGFLVKGSAD